MFVIPSNRLSLQECVRLLDTPGADPRPAQESIRQWAAEPLTTVSVNLLNHMWTQQNVTERALSRYLYFKANAIGMDRLFPYEILERTGEADKRDHLVKIYAMGVEINESEDKERHDFEPGYFMEDQPGYIVNIPLVLDLEVEKGQTQLHRLITLFQKQAFSDRDSKSEVKVRSRLALILAANRCKSIDKARNRAFKDFKMCFFKPYEIKIFGFFWKPVWHCKELETMHTSAMKTARNFFSALQKIDPVFAETVRSSLEEPANGVNKRVPYQEIREIVKNSIYTREAVTRLRSYDVSRELYLGVMDPDCMRLRNDGKGLFSHYNQIVKEKTEANNQAPTIMSTGYIAPDTAPPLIDLIIKLDQNARAAMFTYFPGAPYLPEPNLMIRILPHTDTVYETFMDPAISGLESRHIVKHVIAGRQLDKTIAIVFQRTGAIPTAIPNRFYTIVNSSSTPLTYERIGRKQTLKALRGITCQSHISPLWGWAYNIARELSVEGSPEINKTLTQVLKIFDPISLAKNFVEDRYSVDDHFYPLMRMYVQYFNTMMGIYNRLTREAAGRYMPPNEVHQILDNEIRTSMQSMALPPHDQVKLYNLCYNNTLALIGTSNKFIDLSVPIPEITRVIFAAAAVGLSIFQTLRSYAPQ